MCVYVRETSDNPLSCCDLYPHAKKRSETPLGDPGRPLRGRLSISGWQPKLLTYVRLLSYVRKLLTYDICIRVYVND